MKKGIRLERCVAYEIIRSKSEKVLCRHAQKWLRIASPRTRVVVRSAGRVPEAVLLVFNDALPTADGKGYKFAEEWIVQLRNARTLT